MARSTWILCFVVASWTAGCGSDDDPRVTHSADPGGVGRSAALAAAGDDLNGYVDEDVAFDASGSVGGSSFEWDFGDGSGAEASTSASTSHRYAAPGRYVVVLTVTDTAGNVRTDSLVVRVTRRPVFAPSQSSSVAVAPGRNVVAVVSPDANELALFAWNGDAFSTTTRVAVAEEPKTVTTWAGSFAVVSRRGHALSLVSIDDPTDVRSIDLPRGTHPYGAAVVGDELFVSLSGTGELGRVALDAALAPTLAGRTFVVEDARGVAALPDGRVAVTRFRSPPDRGEIATYDPETGSVGLLPLEFDPNPSTENHVGGVPSYSSQLAVSPDGRNVAAPSLTANVSDGTFRSGAPLTFETTLRATVSFLDLDAGGEVVERRHQFDNRGFASASVFSSRGDWLFSTMRGAQAVERFDVLVDAPAGSIQDVGFAPSGIALSEDDRWIFVDAYMARELVVYDAARFDTSSEPHARLPIVSAEPLSPTMLRGKQLFNDSQDPRIARDSYIACAHCHMDGDADRRTWDFTDRGEGLRNTISLLGRAGMGDGPVHWSANFDEIQDFENDIRGAFGGLGLLSDSEWNSGSVATTLGDSKAARSDDLDALAVYVASLDSEKASPFRNADGSLSPEAVRGKALFESPAAGCTGCHSGPRLTDSGFDSTGAPVLHDIGTTSAGSGLRLGAALPGIDTPTLHGLWHSAPYLHDGSAETLREVLTTRNAGDQHGTTSALSAAEIDDLIAYLSSLDGRID